VGAVLDAIHRDQDFVTDCQDQVWRQRGAKIDRWSKVRVRTLVLCHVETIG
jgi:hypothetical protein